MAQKKSANDDKINFRLPAEMKRDLEDLAHLSRRDVSSLLVEMCAELVKANRSRIISFRRSAAQPIKLPTFATPSTKTAAQDKPTSDALNKGGDQQ